MNRKRKRGCICEWMYERMNQWELLWENMSENVKMNIRERERERENVSVCLYMWIWGFLRTLHLNLKFGDYKIQMWSQREWTQSNRGTASIK
jgi:hypothetical protein